MSVPERTYWLDVKTQQVMPGDRLPFVNGSELLAERELLELVRQAQNAMHEFDFVPTGDLWGLPGCSCGWRLGDDHSVTAAEEAWDGHRDEVAE